MSSDNVSPLAAVPSSDVHLLIALLRREALLLMARYTGRSWTGLQAASNFAQLSSNWRRRCREWDAALGLAEKISQASVATALAGLETELKSKCGCIPNGNIPSSCGASSDSGASSTPRVAPACAASTPLRDPVDMSGDFWLPRAHTMVAVQAALDAVASTTLSPQVISNIMAMVSRIPYAMPIPVHCNPNGGNSSLVGTAACQGAATQVSGSTEEFAKAPDNREKDAFGEPCDPGELLGPAVGNVATQTQPEDTGALVFDLYGSDGDGDVAAGVTTTEPKVDFYGPDVGTTSAPLLPTPPKWPALDAKTPLKEEEKEKAKENGILSITEIMAPCPLNAFVPAVAASNAADPSKCVGDVVAAPFATRVESQALTPGQEIPRPFLPRPPERVWADMSEISGLPCDGPLAHDWGCDEGRGGLCLEVAVKTPAESDAKEPLKALPAESTAPSPNEKYELPVVSKHQQKKLRQQQQKQRKVDAAVDAESTCISTSKPPSTQIPERTDSNKVQQSPSAVWSREELTNFTTEQLVAICTSCKLPILENMTRQQLEAKAATIRIGDFDKESP